MIVAKLVKNFLFVKQNQQILNFSKKVSNLHDFHVDVKKLLRIFVGHT